MKKLTLFFFGALIVILYLQCSSQPSEIALASFYSDIFQGRTTANGEVFD